MNVPLVDNVDRGMPAGVWVVIAAYREGRVVGSVVRGLRAAAYRDVVVVDDGSPDDTAAQASSAGAVVLRHAVNLGQGAALQTGIDYALLRGAAYVVTFDADGQHEVGDVAAMIRAARDAGADVAFGSRFLGRANGLPAWRRLVLKLAVAFTFFTTGMRMTDAHNGLRVLTRRAAARVRLRHNGMAHASEFVEQVARLRLKFVEVPVTINYSEYSLAKGQRVGNAFGIIADLIAGRMHR